VSMPSVAEWSAFDAVASLGASESRSGILRQGGDPVRVDGEQPFAYARVSPLVRKNQLEPPLDPATMRDCP
jgi:hypothetical protein